MSSAFRSLAVPAYRLWASGAIVSNVGTWMQRTAQDWLVLTQLTHQDATAVGAVLALQFGPQLLLLPVTGLAADRFDRRTLLMLTQGVMGALALGLGLLTVTGAVQLWQVYLFAFLLGCAAAFDAPARQTFVAELVEPPLLSNAVGLNSTSFNIARLIGPAVAGLLIAAVGTGWVFLINAASFAAVLISLVRLGRHRLRSSPRAPRRPGDFVEGFRYVRRHRDLLVVVVMFFLIGTFGANFPIFLSTMAVSVFHADASAFGVLSSVMAVGSVIGALLAARRERPRLAFLVGGAGLFGVALGVAALMPAFLLFAVVLVVVGIAAQTFTTSATSIAQLGTDAAMRGRVMAIMIAVGLGATPIGAPLVGWVADTAGPRWSLAVGAASGILAAAIGLVHLLRGRRMPAPAAESETLPEDPHPIPDDRREPHDPHDPRPEDRSDRDRPAEGRDRTPHRASDH